MPLRQHLVPALDRSEASARLAGYEDEPGVLAFPHCPRPRDRRHDAPISARCGRAVPVQPQDARIPNHRSTLRLMTGVARTGSRIQAM